MGFPVTQEDLASRFAGVSDREMYSRLERQYGKAIPGDLRRRVAEETMDALASDLQPIPGVLDAIKAISLPKCVASGSDSRRVHVSLSRTRLLEHFSPHIFTSEEVDRGKPAPDLFLYAARRLQSSPARCLVIEDSVAGVQAGLAAGMCVLGFVGGSHCAANRAETLRSAGAARVFDSMRHLPTLVAEAHQREF